MARELTYSSDDEPGIRRSGRRRFSYRDEVTGRAVTGKEARARIAALAVPPAWTDVWICRDPTGHLQATGRDDRGRKQYRYHPEYRRRREADKFADLVPFGEALGPLRTRLRADLDGHAWDFDHVVALVLALLDVTHARVGNEHYARENGTFGLTTLRDRHVRDANPGVRLHFVGKAGKEVDITVDDAQLARQVRRCRELPGQLLFQWTDVRGERHPVRSTEVNERLRELTGIDATAKSFRTWGASLRAAVLLSDEDLPERQSAADRLVVDAIDDVAAHLGNTRAVARASYVHPAIPAAFEAGRLGEWWAKGPKRAAGGLEADERRLLQVLRRARRAGLPPATGAKQGGGRSGRD